MKAAIFWMAFILMFFALDASDDIKAAGPAGDITTWQSIKAVNDLMGPPNWAEDRGWPPDPWGFCWGNWDPTYCKKIRQRAKEQGGAGPWAYRPGEEPWNQWDGGDGPGGNGTKLPPD